MLLSEFAIQDPSSGIVVEGQQGLEMSWMAGKSIHPTSLLIHEEAVWLAVGSKKGNIHVTSLRFDQGKIHHSFKSCHESNVSVLERVNDVSMLSGSWDKRIKLWDLNSGLLVREFWEHSSQVSSIKMHPNSSHNNVFMSTGIDGCCLLWVSRVTIE